MAGLPARSSRGMRARRHERHGWRAWTSGRARAAIPAASATCSTAARWTTRRWTGIVLQAEEISEYRLVPLPDALSLLRKPIRRRVRAVRKRNGSVPHGARNALPGERPPSTPCAVTGAIRPNALIDGRQPAKVVGTGQVRQRDEDGADAALGEQPVPADVVSGDAGMVPARERAAAVRPRSVSTIAATCSRSRPITGMSSTVTATSAGSRPACSQLAAATPASLSSSTATSDGRLQPSASRAAIRERALAAAADDDRDRRTPGADSTWFPAAARARRGRPSYPAARARAASRSLSRAGRAGYAAAGTAARRRRARVPTSLPRCRRTRGRRSARPASPPSWPGCRAARKVTGLTSVPEPQTGVQAGQQAEGHPGFGDRLPGTADLRDLNQVIHQRQAAESCLGGGNRYRLQPPGRIVGPAEPGDLEDELQPGRPVSCVLAAAAATRRMRGLAARPAAGLTTASQPSAAELSGDLGHPAQLRSPAPRQAPAAPASRLRCRQRAGSVSNSTATAGSPAAEPVPGMPRRRPASRPSVSTTVVSCRRARAATIWSSSANASAEASRSCSPLPTTARS